MPVAEAGLRLERVPGLDDLREPWTSLAAASGNIFSTWEWAHVWWRHYGDGRTPRPVACRDSTGRVVGVLPLYRSFARPARVVRFLGHGPADQLGPVCAPKDAVPVADALRESARELAWDVLLAERLPDGGPVSERLRGAPIAREASPIVAIEGLTWDEYLADRSSNFRSQIRRKERKLIREHGLSYRLSDDPERLDSDLDSLFALHGARWQGEGSGALEGTRQRFHRDFAAVALERGWLRLWLAEVGGRPIAAWYGFRFGGADWYYQFGRDPDWDRSSIGVVLLAHTLREAIADGQAEYKLLRGGEAYKDRFATGDPGLVTTAVPGNGRGRLAIAVARGGLAMPASMRGRLTRAVG